MISFAIPANIEGEKRAEQEIRSFIKYWVGLLAEGRFAEALSLLSSEIPPGSGSIDSRRIAEWTPELLKSVIANYGLPNPVEGQPQSYSVVQLDSALVDSFEANLFIDFDREAISDLHHGSTSAPATGNGGSVLRRLFHPRSKVAVRSQSAKLGSAEFDLPLNFARGNDLGDLTVRMLFKPISTAEMALVLLDIHVL
jgi:hypothetical protein